MPTQKIRGMIRTPFAHVRYMVNGSSHTKIVKVSDYKCVDNIKNLCARLRRKDGAEAFEVALVFDCQGATIYKIVLEYVNSRWIKRRY